VSEVPTRIIGGLPIVILDRTQTASLMVDLALARRGTADLPLVFTSANGQVLSQCARTADIRRMFLDFDLIHADGMPLVFASKLLLDVPLPERVATTDLFHDVARGAEKLGVSFYLLGAKPAVMRTAVRRIRSLYPNLNLVGYRDGYFGRDAELDVASEINSARPDILWVGLGVPAEQRFALRNRVLLPNVGLIKTAGGLFDFLAGKCSRAPHWMQAAGLEWLYRVFLEPRRLALRYLTTSPHAAMLLLARTSRAPSGMVRLAGALDMSPRDQRDRLLAHVPAEATALRAHLIRNRRRPARQTERHDAE
jgi:N-acetylglucosaminyldiphosphoundecaprenol N-acetyl-beta-D-mannosaminyltransferase